MHLISGFKTCHRLSVVGLHLVVNVLLHTRWHDYMSEYLVSEDHKKLQVVHDHILVEICQNRDKEMLKLAQYLSLQRISKKTPSTHLSILPLLSKEGLFSPPDVRTIILQRRLPSGIRFYDCNLTPFLCPISDRAVTHFKGRRHQITVRPYICLSGLGQ